DRDAGTRTSPASRRNQLVERERRVVDLRRDVVDLEPPSPAAIAVHAAGAVSRGDTRPHAEVAEIGRAREGPCGDAAGGAGDKQNEGDGRDETSRARGDCGGAASRA